MWTKKYDEFCLSQKLCPSSKLLMAWIVRRTKNFVASEIEIDLKDFNKWIAKKRGKPYDRKNLKSAHREADLCEIAQFLDKTEGLIVLLTRVTWYYFKLHVKPLSYLCQEKKPRTGKSSQAETSQPSWHHSSVDKTYKQQQQNIIQIDNLLQKVGLKYDSQAIHRIWRLSGKCINRIVKAIELLLYRHQHSAIARPHGFIIECLKHNWQEGFDPYYEPELPLFISNRDLCNFVDEIRVSSFSPGFQEIKGEKRS